MCMWKRKKIVCMTFARPQPFFLRSLDLVHLSTARTASAKCFVTRDERLREAALVAGFEVVP